MLWLLLQFRAQNPDSVCLLNFWGEVPLCTKTLAYHPKWALS